MIRFVTIASTSRLMRENSSLLARLTRRAHRWIGRLAEHGRGTALLHARTETEWFRMCWEKATVIPFMAKRLIFVRPDGSECTTRSGDKANSGAPPVLVAFGEDDARRLRQFASEHGGALVDGWKLFGAASLFSEAAE